MQLSTTGIQLKLPFRLPSSPKTLWYSARSKPTRDFSGIAESTSDLGSSLGATQPWAGVHQSSGSIFGSTMTSNPTRYPLPSPRHESTVGRNDLTGALQAAAQSLPPPIPPTAGNPFPVPSGRKRGSGVASASSIEEHGSKRHKDGRAWAEQELKKLKRLYPKALTFIHNWYARHDPEIKDTTSLDYAIPQLDRSKTSASSHHFWKDATRSLNKIGQWRGQCATRRDAAAKTLDNKVPKIMPTVVLAGLRFLNPEDSGIPKTVRKNFARQGLEFHLDGQEPDEDFLAGAELNDKEWRKTWMSGADDDDFFAVDVRDIAKLRHVLREIFSLPEEGENPHAVITVSDDEGPHHDVPQSSSKTMGSQLVAPSVMQSLDDQRNPSPAARSGKQLTF
jgi:hypothetical protein